MRLRGQVTGMLIVCGLMGGAAPAAQAAYPTDPQANLQAPLHVMHVGEALDRLARPLQDVPVLVADTGLDLDHPDLQSRILPNSEANSDFVGNTFPGSPGTNECTGDNVNYTVNPDNDPTDPIACFGHGTQVAGLLGAAWNNGVGGAGVAPNARYIPYRTCAEEDFCLQYVQDDAINRAAARGARVVTFSFSLYSPTIDPDFAAAITNHPNILFVANPGSPFESNVNKDANPDMPCALNAPNLICATSSGNNDQFPCGDEAPGFGPTTVDIAVPTTSITTTNKGGFTSSACYPSYVSTTLGGIATILFGLVPQATGAQVKNAIMTGARPVAAWRGKTVTGGIADAAGAVDVIQDQFGLGKKDPDVHLRLVVKAKQPIDKVRAKATCDVACSVIVGAKGKAGGTKFTAAPVTKTLAAGVEAQIALPLKKKTAKKLSGEHGKGTVSALAVAGGKQSVASGKFSLK